MKKNTKKTAGVFTTPTTILLIIEEMSGFSSKKNLRRNKSKKMAKFVFEYLTMFTKEYSK